MNISDLGKSLKADRHKHKLLLHCCCAPCSTVPLLRLSENYDVTLLFYNPNIHPADEYKIRKEEIVRFCTKTGIALLVEEGDDQAWFNAIKGRENEPEGGRRCELCYIFRLRKTAEIARKNHFQSFGSTLTISPHKKADIVNRAGREIGKTGPEFIEADFKKQDGFRLSCQISKTEGFYRQNYCGCIYSRRPQPDEKTD